MTSPAPPPKRKRGAANHRNCKVVSITLPVSWEPHIAKAIHTLDSDRSKLMRAAVREWLEKRGTIVPEM